jgi:mono/diheme cytochrome c family protein
MKRLLNLVGLSIALAILVTACGTEALSRPDADSTKVALAVTTTPIVEVLTEIHTEELAEILTEEMTDEPTEVPATETPTTEPTVEPTDVPTVVPTVAPTDVPTEEATEAVVATVAATSQVASAGIPSEEEIAAAVDAADAANGQTLVNVVAPPCSSCHNFTSEAQIVGPGLYNLVNRAGTRIEGQGPYSYTYNSILHSMDFIVEGFPPAMPAYDGVLTDDEVYDIIAYLWTLHD